MSQKSLFFGYMGIVLDQKYGQIDNNMATNYDYESYTLW